MEQSQAKSTGKIRRYARDEVPEGAVRMSVDEVESRQWQAIRAWKPKYEMWAFTHAATVQGAFAAGTGLFLNQHFRKAFKLMHFGRLTTAVPIIFIPGVTAAISTVLLSRKMIIGDVPCPVCAEIKAASVQLIGGFFQPLIMAPVAAAIIAKRQYTIALPALIDLPENMKLVRNTLRPVKHILLGLFLAQIAVGSLVAYNQQATYYKLLDYHEIHNG